MKYAQGYAEKFLEAIRAGARKDVAAQYAGVTEEIVDRWLALTSKQGKEFARAFMQARSDLALLAIGHVRRNIAEDKAAAIWFAERLAADSEYERLKALTTD
jgi:RPA family protein